MTYEEELTRVVDYLRSMPLPKLSRSVESSVGGPTRADLARELAQWLADAGARAEGQPLRAVPDVGDPAVGDQVAVTGADLLRAQPDPAVLAEASDRLRALRLTV